MCVPNGYISSLLAKHRIKVTRIDYERNREDDLTSNVRIATVPWSFDGLKGTALIFLQGRSPRCHRCQERGHKFFECDRPYCRRCRRVGHEESEACNRRTYAQTAGREQEVDQDDMDLQYDDENATRETTRRATTEMQQQELVDWFEQTEPPTVTENTAVQQRDETVAPGPTMTETTAAAAEIEAVSLVTETEAVATASTATTAKEPATVNVTETAMLQSDISDHNDHDGDGDGESSASSGDGFKKPRSRRRSKKRSAVSDFTSSDAAPTKLKAPRSATERKTATRLQQETTVLDPTTGRRHSRTRIPTGRRLSAGDIAIDQ